MKMKNRVITILACFVLALAFSCQDELDTPQLQAEFSADQQEVTAGSEVNFSDASAGNPSRWDWTFEGGTPATSELSSPKVIYEMPGTYKVTLMVGRSNDSTAVTKDAFISVGYGQLTTDFSADKTTVTQGESITFTDLSQGIPTSWAWEFIPVDGGTTLTSDQQNPTVTFENPGVYTVKLETTNPAGTDEATKTDWITIIDASYVEAAFTADFQGTYSGGTIHFSDASLGTAKTWNWTFEGGTPATSEEQNPAVTYSAPGRYQVKLVVTNDFTSAEVEVADYVLVVPSDGLAAFFPFDGSGNDAGPNKADAANQGIGTILFNESDRKSVNPVAMFDGASVLVVPDHNAFNFGTSDFSVACWIKTDQTNKMMIWQESGANGSKDNQAWLRIGDNTTSRMLRFAVEDDTGGKILNSETGVSDNEWHHVVCVRSGMTSTVYIDGTLVLAGDASTMKAVSNPQPFKIGGQETGGGGSYSSLFTGSLDELILYNRALTSQEITSLFEL